MVDPAGIAVVDTPRGAPRPRRRGRRPRCRRRAVARAGAGRSTSGTDSSSVAAWVTRAASSWASSITTTSYSGIIGTPSIASMASSEWLVTISWDWRAFSLARSAKHSSANGHFARAQALAVVHRDLPPDPVGVLGRRVAIARPLVSVCSSAQARSASTSLPIEPSRQVDQGALVVGHALADPVQAGVVGPALEHGVRRLPVQHVVRGLEQGRDVALDELVLQGQGGRRDDHPPVVEQRGDEVAEGLAGAGAGLDEQVLAGGHRLGHRLGHLDLAGPLLAAEGLHGRGEHFTYASGRRSFGGGHRRILPSRSDASASSSTARLGTPHTVRAVVADRDDVLPSDRAAIGHNQASLAASATTRPLIGQAVRRRRP